jgi:antitoxin component YwqK of YwqJK toxin-antitoxin module
MATYKSQGKDERHGMQTSWYPSGAMQMQGEYRDDLQVGKFTWWYENGQKAQEGNFEDGKQAGIWVWWHPNGQKSIQGKYAAGDPSGRWNWWEEGGKLAQQLDMSLGTSVVVKQLTPPAKNATKKPDAVGQKPVPQTARGKGPVPAPNRTMRR